MADTTKVINDECALCRGKGKVVKYDAEGAKVTNVRVEICPWCYGQGEEG